QQGLADDPSLVADALQKERLAVLIGLLEFDVEEARHQSEDYRQDSRLCAQRPQPPDKAELIPLASSGSRSRHSSRSERTRGRHPGRPCGSASPGFARWYDSRPP